MPAIYSHVVHTSGTFGSYEFEPLLVSIESIRLPELFK